MDPWLPYTTTPGGVSIAYAVAGSGPPPVTDVVRQLVSGKGFLFAARTPGLYEGSDEPVAIYELRWRA